MSLQKKVDGADFMLVSFLLGILASIIAGLAIPSIRKGIKSFFIQLYICIVPHEVSLTDHWEAKYLEPDSDGSTLQTTEIIDLKQQGTSLSGRSKIGDPYPRGFCYEGQIYHNLVWGRYYNANEEKGATSGRGIFFLELSTDRRSMHGFCAWLDEDTKKVESSGFDWTRK